MTGVFSGLETAREHAWISHMDAGSKYSPIAKFSVEQEIPEIENKIKKIKKDKRPLKLC